MQSRNLVMSDDKSANNDPERTLLTLDQLSQTIEVMANVVSRLRLHLGEQIKAQIASQQAVDRASAAAKKVTTASSGSGTKKAPPQRQSFIVEVSQTEAEAERKSTKTLH
jgi:hypothetical protein